jgi:demethylmenaquinone methyltransferase/2-methoxy-6-polyprenyl-1,4-benzoquinol methylase
VKTNTSYEINNKNPEEKKRFIKNLFDSIVPTYDILNHLLSMGTDMLWRRNIFRHINDVQNKNAIDLCCGTGDLSLLLHQKGAKVFSLDFSMNMLQKGLGKKAIKDYPVSGDASLLPCKDNLFSAATIAFGIRNIPDIDNLIKEVFRVLTSGGEFVILELVRPENPIIKSLYSFYLNKLLPFIGGIVSGEKTAYKYLSGTISTFLDPDDLQSILEKYGFKNICHYRQTFGVATIIVCEKDLS